MITGKFCMNVLAVGTDDGKSTYEISRKWGEGGKKALVIELYPTISVDKCGVMDVSTMHLLNHVNDFAWDEMRIVNLYANVVTGKPNVSQLTNNSLAYIEEILEEEDINSYDIVIAWGNSLLNHKDTIDAKIDLLSMLGAKGLTDNVKCISVDGLNTKISYGIHPLYLGLHYQKAQWKLIGFPVKEYLAELENRIKPAVHEVKKKDKKTGKKGNETGKKKEGE